jgi:hypothetical protein
MTTDPSRDARLARHREAFRRFMLVHLLAYLPATVAAAAALPTALDGALGGSPSTRFEVVALVLRAAALPFVATWFASHGLGARWVVSLDERGKFAALVVPLAGSALLGGYAFLRWLEFSGG